MTLLESDYAKWALENAKAIRNGQPFDSIRVAEQLELLAITEDLELCSRFADIIELKLAIDAGHNERQERAAVHRNQMYIKTLLNRSPSLKEQLTPKLMRAAYEQGKNIYAIRYSIMSSPLVCPYSWEELIGE